MTALEATIERWPPAGGAASVVIETEADIDALIDDIQGDQSALVELQLGSMVLYLGVSEGSWTVTAVLEDDEILDLVEPDAASHPVETVQGGQRVDVPARQLLERRRARRALLHVLRTGSIDPSDEWERQA